MNWISMAQARCPPDFAPQKVQNWKLKLQNMSFDDVLLLVRLLYVLKQHCITHIVVKILKPTQQPQTQSHPKLPAITWLFTIFLLTFLYLSNKDSESGPTTLPFPLHTSNQAHIRIHGRTWRIIPGLGYVVNIHGDPKCLFTRVVGALLKNSHSWRCS